MFKRLSASFALVSLLGCVPVLASNVSFECKTDKADAMYKPGEEMVFKIQLLDEGKPSDGWKLKWKREGDDRKTENGEAVSSATEPLTLKTSLEKPGFVHMTVEAFDAEGKPAVNAKGAKVQFSGGAGVEIDKLAGSPEPADFDEFWAKQKEKLAAVPVKAELKEMASAPKGFKLWDVQVDCAGVRPVRGYLSMPVDAKEKSLAAKVSFMGYGVGSAGMPCEAGAICFQINAHGIENGREQAYYDELKNGELKGYAFKNEENENPETAYFNGMMLRVMRALQYVKTLPEWNGKDLIVSGGSQGGLQCLSAAGLDADVTRCEAGIPWCCDLGGNADFGRLTGWRPAWRPALAYYDPINHAKRIKCPVVINAGLGDYVCPPSGVAILYNNIKTPKKLTFTQGFTHGGFGYDAPKDPQKAIFEVK